VEEAARRWPQRERRCCRWHWAQFVASYAGSNMNVAISSIAKDLNTSVTGIQTTITLFTLTMAALMIPAAS